MQLSDIFLEIGLYTHIHGILFGYLCFPVHLLKSRCTVIPQKPRPRRKRRRAWKGTLVLYLTFCSGPFLIDVVTSQKDFLYEYDQKKRFSQSMSGMKIKGTTKSLFTAFDMECTPTGLTPHRCVSSYIFLNNTQIQVQETCPQKFETLQNHFKNLESGLFVSSFLLVPINHTRLVYSSSEYVICFRNRTDVEDFDTFMFTLSLLSNIEIIGVYFSKTRTFQITSTNLHLPYLPTAAETAVI